jgi:hypothetical protein
LSPLTNKNFMRNTRTPNGTFLAPSLWMKFASQESFMSLNMTT